MLFPLVSAVAVAALAGHAVADPMAYTPVLAKMSVRNVLGLGSRQDNSVYQPDQMVCGDGATCAEACGAGFEECVAADSTIHCFDASAQQVCCLANGGK
jgi:hypothetical protein